MKKIRIWLLSFLILIPIMATMLNVITNNNVQTKNETKPVASKKRKKSNIVFDYLHEQQIAANNKSDLQLKLRKLFNFYQKQNKWENYELKNTEVITFKQALNDSYSSRANVKVNLSKDNKIISDDIELIIVSENRAEINKIITDIDWTPATYATSKTNALEKIITILKQKKLLSDTVRPFSQRWHIADTRITNFIAANNDESVGSYQIHLTFKKRQFLTLYYEFTLKLFTEQKAQLQPIFNTFDQKEFAFTTTKQLQMTIYDDIKRYLEILYFKFNGGTKNIKWNDWWDIAAINVINFTNAKTDDTNGLAQIKVIFIKNNKKTTLKLSLNIVSAKKAEANSILEWLLPHFDIIDTNLVDINKITDCVAKWLKGFDNKQWQIAFNVANTSYEDGTSNFKVTIILITGTIKIVYHHIL